jgi:hypothetical protein
LGLPRCFIASLNGSIAGVDVDAALGDGSVATLFFVNPGSGLLDDRKLSGLAAEADGGGDAETGLILRFLVAAAERKFHVKSGNIYHCENRQAEPTFEGFGAFTLLGLLRLWFRLLGLLRLGERSPFLLEGIGQRPLICKVQPPSISQSTKSSPHTTRTLGVPIPADLDDELAHLGTS